MLSTKLGKVKLNNPLVLASGILGTNETILSRVAKTGIGAITTKSIGPKEKIGNKNPSVVEWEHGFLNAVGLPSPGIDNADEELSVLSKLKKPVIFSCYGHTIDDFVMIAKKFVKYKPAMIELDASCPNIKDGMHFASDKDLAFKLTKKVKAVTGSIPVSVKLSPNVTDIVEIAKACEKGGADCLTAINAAKGMLIDVNARKPVLAFKTGGMSGPALKPIAVRCVYELYENVKIPIIGTGGVSNGKDAVEMLMAGASAVGVGTAVYYRTMKVFDKITKEMQAWMRSNNVKSIKEIIGAAH